MELQYKTVEFADTECDWEKRWVGKEATLDYDICSNARTLTEGWFFRCIIVDSTRRGKSMPDAMSKTVPIWCAVINRLLFGEAHQSHILRTPDEVVAESEHAQIEARLDAFVKDAEVGQLNTLYAFIR
jgi:hypothetical protein